jgi:hypothetical protein
MGLKGYRLWVMGYGLWVMGYGLWVMGQLDSNMQSPTAGPPWRWWTWTTRRPHRGVAVTS